MSPKIETVSPSTPAFRLMKSVITSLLAPVSSTVRFSTLSPIASAMDFTRSTSLPEASRPSMTVRSCTSYTLMPGMSATSP